MKDPRGNDLGRAFADIGGVLAANISRTAKIPMATAPRVVRMPIGTATARAKTLMGQKKLRLNPSAIAAPKIKGGRATTSGPPDDLSCMVYPFWRADVRSQCSDPAPDAGFIVPISLPESSFKIGFFRFYDAFLQNRREDDGEKKCP